MTMKYRSDIDGLRAIAVLSVVAYHFNFGKLVPGGFVGVDIFFVLSGFLITRIIFDEISERTYSIANFYERRVRRLFPALFVMFAACLVASNIIGLQAEIGEAGRSIAASIFFVSNIFFYHSSGYFDGDLIRNPVLHTWSLSVEEQFYVLFPIFIFAIRKLSLSTQKTLLVAVALISFAASVWRVEVEPNGAFYLVYFRAWELLLGGLVALGIFPVVRRKLAREAIALAGLAAIALSIRLYSRHTPFPGLAALLPCAGTAAVIYAGGCGQTFVSRLLSIRPAQFFGLISYSLYLWHWPLVAYYSSFRSLEGSARFALLAVAVAIATASWWYVERPFRQKPFRLGRRGTLGIATTAMAVVGVAAFGAGPLAARYWPDTDSVNRMAAFEDYDNVQSARTGTCLLKARTDSLRSNCLALAADRRNVLIVGDSHAAHLWAGYQTVFPDVNFLQATGAGCKPYLNASRHQHCKQLMEQVFAQFLPTHRVDMIIMSGRWVTSDLGAAIAASKTLRQYAPRVVISGPIQEYDLSLPFLLAQAEDRGENLSHFAHAHLQPGRKRTDEVFAAATWPEGVEYVSVYNALCAPNCVLTVDDDVPVQFDYGHLTREGAIYLAQKVG